MTNQIRKLLLHGEDSIREACRNNPLIHRLYETGLVENLSIEQISLLLVSHLLIENETLKEFQQMKISLEPLPPFIEYLLSGLPKN